MKTYSFLDLHTCGEPFRLVIDGFQKDIPGTSMEEKRCYAAKHLNDLRRSVILEPRGHDDMYGGLLLPPVNAGSDLGILFMMAEGWTTMCGHGILCAARAAVELGIVPNQEGEQQIFIDAPAATVCAAVNIQDGIVRSVRFENDLSCVCATNLNVEVPQIGTVQVDVSYGAAFMVFTSAHALGISLSETPFPETLQTALKCRDAVMASIDVSHPLHPEKHLQKNGCCMILVEEVNQSPDVIETRCFTVFGDSQYDRSPTGTGTSALAALLHERGILQPRMRLVNRGISGLPFITEIKATEGGVIPTISAKVYTTAKGTLIMEEDDPFRHGYSAVLE